MSVSEIITSSKKPYEVKLIATLNPHIFWLEPILQSNDGVMEHHIIQAGLANVFPADIKAVEPIYQIQRYSSSEWIAAGCRLLQQIVSAAQVLYFLPLHVMPNEFSIINDVTCIFGELFVINEDKLECVTKLLSGYGVLYKSVSRFEKYLKTGKVFIDLQGEELDKVVDIVLDYANESYESLMKNQKDPTEVRELVSRYKCMLKEHMSENNNREECDKVMQNMEGVYDTCIRMAEDEGRGSVRVVGNTKRETSNNNAECVKEKQVATCSKTNTDSTDASPRTSFMPAGARFDTSARKSAKFELITSPMMSDNTDKVQRYIEDIRRNRSGDSKGNALKSNVTDVIPSSSPNKTTDPVSPNIISFIQSVPIDPYVKKQSDEVMSQCGSVYDCDDIENSIISQRTSDNSFSSYVAASDSDDTLVKPDDSLTKLNIMFPKKKLAKTSRDKAETNSVVSTTSTSHKMKLKFVNSSLKGKSSADDRSVSNSTSQCRDNSSSDASSTSSTSLNHKLKFVSKRLMKDYVKSNVEDNTTSKSNNSDSGSPSVASASSNMKLKLLSKKLTRMSSENNLEGGACKSNNQSRIDVQNDENSSASEVNSVISTVSTSLNLKMKLLNKSLTKSSSSCEETKKDEIKNVKYTRNKLRQSKNLITESEKRIIPNGFPNPLSCSSPGDAPPFASDEQRMKSLHNDESRNESINDVSLESIAEEPCDVSNIDSSCLSLQKSSTRGKSSASKEIDAAASGPRDHSKSSNSAENITAETSSEYVEHQQDSQENQSTDPNCDPDLIVEEADKTIESSGSYTNWNVTNMLRFGVDTLGIKAPFTMQRRSASPELKRSVSPKNYVNAKHYDAYKDVSYYGDLVEKVTNLKIVVHNKTNEISVPYRDLESTHFLQIILKNLKTLGVKAPSKLQSLVWPTAFGDRSTFVISPVSSGRGLSILAPVCNKLPKIVLADRPEGIGPILMIVCPDIFAASKAYSSCKVLLKDCITIMGDEFRIIKMDDWTDSNNLYYIVNGVDVLVTTSQCLYQLLNYEVSVINLDRLLYLIFEDLDILNEQFHDETKRIIDVCQKVNENETNERLRTYATSQVWCELFERLAKESYNPTVVVSALQECLFYSKAKLDIAITTEDRKLKRLEDVFNNADNTFRRIVIVCNNNEEINNVNDLLKDTYLTCIADTTMTIDILNDIRKSWKNHNLRTGTVIIITTDENLQFLDICDAHWLIHYSLPVTYARFNLRFATMADNYPNLYIKEKRVQLKVNILITEDDLVRLPKLSQFIARYNIEIPEDVQNVLKKVIKNQDIIKADTCVPLCERLSAFGYCSDTWSCIERHSLVTQDHPNEWIPKVGKVKCYVTSVHHASLYSARLLEYTDLNSKKHAIPQNHIVLLFELSAYFSAEGNRKCHGAVKCGDICAVKVESDYKRCRVLRIIPVTNERRSDVVRVNLLDEESYLDVKRHELLHLPDRWKEQRSTIVKVRLAGVLPSIDNHFWSTSAIDNVKTLLSTDEDLVIQGNIVLGIGNTLWLDDIQICRHLETLGVDIVKCNLKRNLISNGYAIENAEHLKVLYDFCKSFNFQLPSFQKCIRKPVLPKHQIKPQWAHLNETFADVFFSYGESLNLFFIRHKAFSKILDDLENELESHVGKMKEKFINTDDEITEESIKRGYYCVALFVDEGTYGRVQVLKIVEYTSQSKLYECYFVDHGEKRVVRSEDTYPLTEDFIRRLPFQAIECRMFGVKPTGDHWNLIETDKLYDFSFIGDTTDLKVLVAKYYTKEKAECTNGYKYGVILVDCGMRLSFTDYIIDINLALPVADEMELIKKDENDINNLYQEQFVDGDDDEINVENKYRDPSLDLNGIEWPEDDDSDDDVWDCQFHKEDYEELLKRDHLPRITEGKSDDKVKKQLIETSRRDENVKKIISVINTNLSHKTPRLLWHQTNQHVTIKIMLADVNVYECSIGPKTLYFETNVDFVHYKLDIELSACIKVDDSYHTTKGMYVFVHLYKHITKHWNSLTASNTNINSKLLVYDPDFIVVDDDPESDSEEQRVKEALKKRVTDMNEDDQLDSDEDECDDIKNLKLMELDPVNRDILRQMERQIKGSPENESDEYCDDSD